MTVIVSFLLVQSTVLLNLLVTAKNPCDQMWIQVCFMTCALSNAVKHTLFLVH